MVARQQVERDLWGHAQLIEGPQEDAPINLLQLKDVTADHAEVTVCIHREAGVGEARLRLSANASLNSSYFGSLLEVTIHLVRDP